MTIAQQSTRLDLFSRGKMLAEQLRQEGKADGAQTVEALLKAIPPAQKNGYLTPEQVAERLGVNRQTVVKWVKKGWLDGERIAGQMMIPAIRLAKVDELDAVLDALDEAYPPLTQVEIEEILEPERRWWTWVGKDS